MFQEIFQNIDYFFDHFNQDEWDGNKYAFCKASGKTILLFSEVHEIGNLNAKVFPSKSIGSDVTIIKSFA